MKQKIKYIYLFLIFAIFFSFGINASSNVSAETLSEAIRKVAPLEFGYVDNTEYYMQYYFNELSFVDDSCIVVSSESTNFNEFGVFHVTNADEVKRCEELLKTYLKAAKQRFRSGVIYDIDEYQSLKTHPFML